ncbi:DEAD/DEAH box helicase [Kineococcus rubinsiae]|uniref:DEAD/DEAH box helicase n=1 Tax=Kineococcus rubinsiae TaxID=2609562 RepID=UPI0014300407|nr:DEAD/DEAH box helicase [Kineococcus rubinsiae]NIZ93189.1 DEAD/DEAH box helicase [Kineococcus rubinsiae]
MTDTQNTTAPDAEITAALDAAGIPTISDADAVAAAAAAEEAPAKPPAPTFGDFGVDPRIVEALTGAGITTPFPIQAMTLPVALSGHDIIGQAKTGTGKTLGFGVPLLQRAAVLGDDDYAALPHPGKPQALVIVPTRELAVQVAGDLSTASRVRKTRILTVYGGRAYEPQIEALVKGVDVVVGTPGRLLDLAQQKHLDLSQVKCVVLDEADEMLDLGFLPDVERLLAQTHPARQTMLFSATMPGAVVALARSYMRQPTHIRAIDQDDDGATVKAVTQYAYRAHAMDKVEVLARMLQAEGRGLTIIFSRTKRTAASVAEQLAERGFASASIHGDLGQGAREQALRAFRSGKVDVLVATDVAARGIDVEDVTHVINYQCPEDEKTYLHRIGRTARAGNTGIAVTFVDWDDLPRWSLIDKALGLGFGEPPETYSTSPHLFSDLNIPAGTTGRLPRGQRTRAGLEAEEIEDIGEVGAARSRRPGRSGAAEEKAPATESRGPRRQRERRRTVNGEDSGATAGGAVATTTEVAPAAEVPGTQASTTQAPATQAPTAAAPDADAADGDGSADRPRRRRRRTRGRSGGAGTEETSAPTAD